MSKIKLIKAREILDSRGNPTLSVKVILDNDIEGEFSVPSGASTGIFEAYELRDDDKFRYNGKGVLKAKENVNMIINNYLKGKEISNQKELDDLLIKLDNTPNKSNLGANAILGVSIAYAKAEAKNKGLKLYKYINEYEHNSFSRPMMNIINGGMHAFNSLDIQEFMIVPFSSTTFNESLHMCVNVFNELKKLLKNTNQSLGYGDEGGFAPNLENDEEAIKLIIEAIKKAKYIPGVDFKISIDAASSSWYDKNTDSYYLLKSKKHLTKEELISMWEDLVNKYPIFSIEDALSEEDYQGWKLLTERLKNKVLLVGDDLFVTNIRRLEMGIKNQIANSILIKLNQIGTLSETMETIKLAKENNYVNIISHRSGETNDSFIADLAFATNSFIKAGAPNRGERVKKYNRLLEIEEEL